MNRKSILAIAPIVPDQSEITRLERTLAFLEPYYRIDFLDPLSAVDIHLEKAAYYHAWQEKVALYLERYDAFVGFSFGGVILQQCFPLFESKQIPIVLFSTPTFVDSALHQKLGVVIELLKKNQVERALSALYHDVFYPHQQPVHDWAMLDQAHAAERLIGGFTRILNTDSSYLIKTTTVNHLHLIGERSNLINTHNVRPAQTGVLLTVPGAGMRVLQDNLNFCKKVIMEALLCEI
jgi:hypothetical protein